MDDVDFREIVSFFVERLHEKIPAMQAAVASKNWSELAGLAHWLKGTSGSVGFPQISEAAVQMEHHISAREVKDVAALLEEVELMLRSIAIE